MSGAENGDRRSRSLSRSASPGLRSVSPDEVKARVRSRTPRSVSRGRSVSRSRSPVKRRSLSRSLSRSPIRKRSFSRDRSLTPRRSRSPRERRRRSPSPYARRRSPSPRRYRSRSPRGFGRYPPPRHRSPYGYRGPPGGGYGGFRRRSPPPTRRQRPPSHGTHVFVAGLNFNCTDKEMERKFEKYGEVVSARVVRNPATNESRGFGFIEMKTDEGVDKAIRALDNEDWNGRRLLVERAKTVRP